MKKNQGTEYGCKTRLLISKNDAEEKIKDRIEQGKAIKNKFIGTWNDFKEVEKEFSKWNRYNYDLLSRIFDDYRYANEYPDVNSASGFRNVFESPLPIQEEKELKGKIEKCLSVLDSILERLELIPETTTNANSLTVSDIKSTKKTEEKDIFIVHGHDEAAKQSMARFLEKLDINPIILHEQPSEGKTVIEKFEKYSEVGFAIVLLTSDDIGYPKDKPEKKKPRARQNVIFELGYFIGKLGRHGACALYKQGVEIPSDYQGVLYILMDEGGAWKLELAKEIKSAGIEVDLNKL